MNFPGLAHYVRPVKGFSLRTSHYSNANGAVLFPDPAESHFTLTQNRLQIIVLRVVLKIL